MLKNYHTIMNTLDAIAKGLRPMNDTVKERLDLLAAEDEITIQDIADANDCNPRDTWEGLVVDLRAQFDAGLRVSLEEEGGED